MIVAKEQFEKMMELVFILQNRVNELEMAKAQAIDDFAFYTLSNLTEADFSECTTLESIGYCAFLETNISTFDFSACKSLKNLSLRIFFIISLKMLKVIIILQDTT